MPFVYTAYKTLSSFLIKWQIKSNEYSHVQINKLEWVLSNPSETHSHVEKELVCEMMVSSPNFSNQSYPVPQPGRATQRPGMGQFGT